MELNTARVLELLFTLPVLPEATVCLHKTRAAATRLVHEHVQSGQHAWLTGVVQNSLLVIGPELIKNSSGPYFTLLK